MLRMLVIKKRINALEKNGVEATILAFKRNCYPRKPFDNDYTLLGNISHGHYYKRLIPFMRDFFKIRDAIKILMLYIHLDWMFFC